MRRGPYEVLLVDAVTGEPLPEVDCGVDGLYTVAEPGSAFKIRVSYDDPITTLVEAAVDGNLLDYHYVLRVPGKAVTFQGFRAVGDFSAYRQFQVSFPEIAIEDESAYGAPATSKKKTFTPEEWQAMQKAGTVEVTFYDARECPNCTEKKRLEQLRSQAIKAEVAPPPSSVKIAESKKVFKSLTTKAGAEFAVDTSAARRNIQVAHKEGPPILTMTVRYQTSSWLVMKKYLDLNNPAHAALIQRSAASAGLPRSPPPPATATTTSGSSTPAGLRPLTLDLSGSRKRNRDEQDVCDLTGESVVWQTTKKPPVTTIPLE